MQQSGRGRTDTNSRCARLRRATSSSGELPSTCSTSSGRGARPPTLTATPVFLRPKSTAAEGTTRGRRRENSPRRSLQQELPSTPRDTPPKTHRQALAGTCPPAPGVAAPRPAPRARWAPWTRARQRQRRRARSSSGVGAWPGAWIQAMRTCPAPPGVWRASGALVVEPGWRRSSRHGAYVARVSAPRAPLVGVALLAYHSGDGVLDDHACPRRRRLWQDKGCHAVQAPGDGRRPGARG